MNYRDFFSLHNIEYQEGLTDEEILKVEKTYGIVFPDDLRNLLQQALPISKGFYKWRDFSGKNVKYILQVINRPFVDVYNNASEACWNDEWGAEPDNKYEFEKIVRTRLLTAPKLIPVYAHRYIPMSSDIDNPIFSIHEVDIIIYGKSLDDYLRNEFEKKRLSIDNISNIKSVPFWSEIL